jgi:ParB family transcriptional regulator, chromosome partitioning protein
MNHNDIELIPLAEIRVLNPRSRGKTRFEEIVASIRNVGLKKPITVSRRDAAPDGTKYDLVCGEGRMKACLALGETMIPAIIRDASPQQNFLMSVVENIARFPPSNEDLFKEVRNLLVRNYTQEEIARKLGHTEHYIAGIVHLAEKGERSLIEAVEAGRLPISVAVEIAGGDDHEVQRALSEAYERGDLRGTKLKSARRLIAQRIARRRKVKNATIATRRLTGAKLVREYQREMRKQRELTDKAAAMRERVLMLASAMRRLLSDEYFITLLRAESLSDMPQQLAE